MSCYGCHNGLDAFIVHETSGVSYFCTLHHSYTPMPYSQIRYTSQMTYRTLMAHGWKPLTHGHVNALAKTMIRDTDTTTNLCARVTTLPIVLGVVCLMRKLKKHFCNCLKTQKIEVHYH